MAIRQVNQALLFQGRDLTALIAALRPMLDEHGAAINLLIVSAPEVVASGSLPAAGTANDGRVIIENGGAGNGNLVIYVGGQRFRLDGGAPI